MMKNSKNRPHGQTDQVMERFQRVRHSFSGAWRCRPCAGDFVSPSPRARQKGQEKKKVSKPDISKDPLFLKPTQPTAREDDRLSIEWRQEELAKENERQNSLSERGKIDGQFLSASQKDPHELKNLEDRDAADSQSQGGNMNGDLLTSAKKIQDEVKLGNDNEPNLVESGAGDSQVDAALQPTSQGGEDSLKPEDETQGKLERGDDTSPQMGTTKTEGLDLLEQPHNATVSDEGAGDRAEDLMSPENQVHGVPDNHSDLPKPESLDNHSDLPKLESLEEFGLTDLTRPSFPGDQFGAQNLESSGDQKTESRDSSGTIKSGLNINIPHSESYSLHEAACEKAKALEENESPVSVLQGIPDVETPKAEDGKLEKAWTESKSHESVQGLPEAENHRGPKSSKEVDVADRAADNIITSLCAFLKLETAQLERPSEDVQRNSSDISEISNPEKELGTSQAYDDNLHQTEDQKTLHPLVEAVPKQDSKSTPEGSNDFGRDVVGETGGPGDHFGVFSEGKTNAVDVGKDTGHSEDGLEEKHSNLEPHDILDGMQGQGKELGQGKLKPEISEVMEQFHSNSLQEEKSTAVQDSVQDEVSHAVHRNEKHFETPGDHDSMSSQRSDLREEGRELEGENLHNADGGELDGGEKTNHDLHHRHTEHGGHRGTKHDPFKSERLEALAAVKGSTLHGIAAASIHGTGKDGSSQLYPDHPDYAELRPHSPHGQRNAQSPHPHLHKEESNSFKIGIFSVPHVLVVGAITVVSLLGKAASG